jgi:hypothetical protein
MLPLPRFPGGGLKTNNMKDKIKEIVDKYGVSEQDAKSILKENYELALDVEDGMSDHALEILLTYEYMISILENEKDNNNG